MIKFKKVKKLVKKELVVFYNEILANEPKILEQTLLNIDEDFKEIESMNQLENTLDSLGFDEPTEFIFNSIIKF